MTNTIYRSCAALTEDQLTAAEADLGLTLPPDYRAFLLRHNGGLARHVTFHFRNKKGKSQEAWLGWIYSVGHEGKLDPLDAELVTSYKERPSGLPIGMLPVAFAWYAGNDGFVCIGCQRPDTGKVFFRPNVDADKDILYSVADSWPEFLDGLTPMDGKVKKWQIAIQDGDVEGLRAILERSKKWQDDPSIQGDLEQEAVEECHWPIIELLLEKGWSAGAMFTRAMGSRRFDLARLLLYCDQFEDSALSSCLLDSDGLLWHLPEFVAELVDHGADVDHQDAMGETPLHKAVEARGHDCVRFLIDRGADPTVKNDSGRTPALLAQRLEEPALVGVLREAEQAWAKRPAPSPQSLKVVEFDFQGVPMTRTGPQLTLADIALFERETKFELPPEYRGFLLQANGGRPDPDRCALPEAFDDEEDEDEEDDDDEEEMEEDEYTSLPAVGFVPLFPTKDESAAEETDDEDDEEGEVLSVQEAIEFLKQTGTPRRMLPIGYIQDYGLGGGGTLLLSCKGKDKGKLFYRDGDLESHEEGAWPVVDSLDALFALLAAEKNRPPTPQDLAERAVKAGDLAALREALANGADPAKATRCGLALMRVAFDAKQDDAVWAMLEAGQDRNEVFEQAVSFGRLALARRMLGFGKGPSKKALRHAMGIYELYADADLVKDLMARGADPNKPARGWAPIHAACTSGHLAGIRVLLEAGADVNVASGEGTTPLMMAVGSQMSASAAGVVKLLLENGAKTGVPDCNGRTALHLAAERGDLETCRLLIEAGEDLHARYQTRMPGMSDEQQAKVARRAAKAMEQMMAMFGDMADDEDVAPIDTSTPTGELLAKAQESIGKQMEQIVGGMGGLQERMAEMAEGSMGKANCAADAARRRAEGQAILEELERIQARVRGKGGERG